MKSYKIQKICDDHNKSMRNTRYMYSYSPDKFLSSLDGNLLITGGTQDKRMRMIAGAISARKRTSYEPVIVFSESNRLERTLISMAAAGEIGRLYICSDEYKNYDLFSSMTNPQIVSYFSDIAISNGFRDTGELTNYIGAFLNILSKKAPVKLASVIQFANNTDTDIANMARDYGLINEYDIITATSKGGISFRRLLNMTENAFEGITQSDCNTDFNIVSAIEEDCIIFVNTSSINYEFLSYYFMHELKSVLNRSFTIIFDDCILLNNEELFSFVNVVKQRNNINVVLSYENILSLPGENHICNFSNYVVFLNGTMPPGDLQSVLSGFGEYTHFEPTTTFGTPPKLFFSIRRTENKNITTYMRPKVLLEEEYGKEVVLRGHNGTEIMIVKRFIGG